MLVLWTYEIRDTVFWAVTGVLDIALLFWLRRTSVRPDADPRRPDRCPNADARSPASDALAESEAEHPGASQEPPASKPERSVR